MDLELEAGAVAEVGVEAPVPAVNRPFSLPTLVPSLICTRRLRTED